jgi:hypothetical protein
MAAPKKLGPIVAPTNAAFDPSGIDLKRQAQASYYANKDAQRTADYGAGGNTIDQAVHMTGPLPDPQWQAFFQALKNNNVSDVTGGPSAPGSKQLRGESVQPDYLSGGDTYAGQLTPTGALKRRAMLDALAGEQDEWEQQTKARIYGTGATPPATATPTTPTRTGPLAQPGPIPTAYERPTSADMLMRRIYGG